MKRLAAAVAVSWIAATAPAVAGEVFVGGLEHAASTALAAGDEEDGVDVQLGFRTDPLSRRILFGHPRAYGLLSINSAGDTNFATAGLLWRRDFNARLYGQFGFGLAVHDGAVDGADADGDPNKIIFGSRVLFESELGLGWRLSDRWGLEASYVHVSNGHIWTDINPGMDDIGARIVYRRNLR